MPQAIKKTKGRWRTKKTVDGKNVHIPLFGRKKKANNTVDKGEYTNAYIAQKKSYMQYQFDGDIGAYTTALASILSGETTGVREYRQMLGYLNGMHQTILNGMNLATFHDLMLSNPRIAPYLQGNPDARYVDVDNVLNAFARRLGLSTNTGNADFDAYRTVDA
jgi:hypothetical protein